MAFGSMAFQVLAKDDRCSHGVHGKFRRISFFWGAVNLSGFTAELFFEQAFGFPTGQPFIGQCGRGRSPQPEFFQLQTPSARQVPLMVARSSRYYYIA